MKRLSVGWLLFIMVGLVMLSGTATATPPSLAGPWVMLQVYPRIALVPMVGASPETSYVVLWVDVQQDGMSLQMSDRYCFSVIDQSSTLATTEIPDAFMRALRPDPREALLINEEGTLAFQQAPHLEIRGARLVNPETDALPDDPEDPRVIDQDADGFPGMTVNVNLLGMMDEQIYVVQRIHYELDGVVISPDRIEGLMRWTDEQVVLAATNPMLLAGAESRPDPDPNKHVFTMLRAQEGWTCEWLREHWREVFGLDEDE